MIETTYKISNAPHIALLTDSHNRPAAPILASLRVHRPSLICIAGDFVYGSTPEQGNLKMVESAEALKLLEGCAAIAPTYISFGNHEWMLIPADLRLIRETGCVVLDNSWTDRDGFVIGGLTSARTAECWKRRSTDERYEKPALSGKGHRLKPDISWLNGFSSVPGYHILLCHHPEYFPLLPGSVDLILSGHAHGGQWRMYNPFKKEWTGVCAPGQGLFPKWTRGLYENRLAVSAGLANTTFIPRINNPAEIVYIHD